MIIVPHHANSYMAASTDLTYVPASGSHIVGLNEIGAVVYIYDTNTQLIVLEDLTLSPLYVNII